MKTLFLHKDVDLSGLLARKPGIEFGLSRSVRADILLGPHLAVRPAALVGLRWDEVNVEKAIATIRGGRGAKLRHGKKPRDFVVPLSSTALELLKALKAAQEQEGIHTGPRDVPGARRVLSKKQLNADFEAMASGLPGEWVFPSASSTGHLSGDVLADAMKRLSDGPQYGVVTFTG